jgi:hypothetical protein
VNSSSIRRPLLAMALIAALLATIAGCGTAATPSPTPAGSRQPTPASSNDADIPLSPVAGVVIAVQSEGLDKVHGFTLRTISGADVNFALGKLDNPTEFPPGHLAEHQASSAPVLVWFTVEGSKLLVYHLEDAP